MFDSTRWMPVQKPEKSQGEPIHTIYTPNSNINSLFENGVLNVGEEARAIAQAAIDGGLGGGMNETCELVNSMSAAMGLSTTVDKGTERLTPSIFIPAAGVVVMSKSYSRLQSSHGSQMLHVIIDVDWTTELLQKNVALLKKLQEYMRK